MAQRGDWPRWLALALVGISVGMAIDATAAPVANFSRTSIRFDNVAPFEGSVQPVFLTNTGDASLHVSAITLGGANASQFTLGGTCSPPVTLAAGGGRCRIEVISAVTSAAGLATRSATVLVTSDAAADPAAITISANVSSGHEPLLRPNWLDFAPQQVGGAGTTQSFPVPPVDFGATLSIDRLVLTGADAADFTAASGLHSPDRRRALHDHNSLRAFGERSAFDRIGIGFSCLGRPDHPSPFALLADRHGWGWPSRYSASTSTASPDRGSRASARRSRRRARSVP